MNPKTEYDNKDKIYITRDDGIYICGSGSALIEHISDIESMKIEDNVLIVKTINGISKFDLKIYNVYKTEYVVEEIYPFEPLQVESNEELQNLWNLNLQVMKLQAIWSIKTN